MHPSPPFWLNLAQKKSLVTAGNKKAPAIGSKNGARYPLGLAGNDGRMNLNRNSLTRCQWERSHRSRARLKGTNRALQLACSTTPIKQAMLSQNFTREGCQRMILLYPWSLSLCQQLKRLSQSNRSQLSQSIRKRA